jgi:hypothetical protein
MHPDLPDQSAPDEVVGRLLRESLEGENAAGFAARVLEALHMERRDSAFDVLARWTRPGLAAAALLALAVGLWLGIAMGRQSAALDDDLLPEPDLVVAALVGGR